MQKTYYSRNLKLYPFYKMISFDLVFYYAISLIFLTNVKGLTASQVLLADSFFLLFKTIFQIPCTILIDKVGKKNSLIFANFAIVMYMILVISCNGFTLYLVADIILALGFVLKGVCESNILYDSIPDSEYKAKIFSKLEGRGTALYFLFEAITSIIGGFLYIINPYIPMIICLIFTILATLLTHLFTHTSTDLSQPNDMFANPESFKMYFKSLLSAFKFIMHSKRLHSLIFFNAVLAGLYPLLATFRRSMLNDISVSAEFQGIIFAVLGLFSAIGSNKSHIIHTKYRNKSLTVLGIPTAFSVVVSGLVIVLGFPYWLMLAIIIICFGTQHFTRGPYYTLIKQYLSSFSTSDMRIKIFSANTLIEGFIGSIISFAGAFLLEYNSTAISSLIIGSICTLLIIILLEYMRTRVGLKPEEYSKKDIHYTEVK